MSLTGGEFSRVGVAVTLTAMGSKDAAANEFGLVRLEDVNLVVVRRCLLTNRQGEDEPAVLGAVYDLTVRGWSAAHAGELPETEDANAWRRDWRNYVRDANVRRAIAACKKIADAGQTLDPTFVWSNPLLFVGSKGIATTEADPLVYGGLNWEYTEDASGTNPLFVRAAVEMYTASVDVGYPSKARLTAAGLPYDLGRWNSAFQIRDPNDTAINGPGRNRRGRRGRRNKRENRQLSLPDLSQMFVA